MRIRSFSKYIPVYYPVLREGERPVFGRLLLFSFMTQGFIFKWTFYYRWLFMKQKRAASVLGGNILQGIESQKKYLYKNT